MARFIFLILAVAGTAARLAASFSPSGVWCHAAGLCHHHARSCGGGRRNSALAPSSLTTSCRIIPRRSLHGFASTFTCTYPAHLFGSGGVKDTALSMGLRSFFKKVSHRGENDEDRGEGGGPNESDGGDDTMEYLGADEGDGRDSFAASSSSPPSFPSRGAMVGDPYGETVQQRMARMKQGGMTPEEKERFLKTALGRRSTITPKKKAPPIRQRLPLGPTESSGSDGDAEGEEGDDQQQQGASSSSHHPSAEASWSTVVGRKRMEQSTGPGAGGSVSPDALMKDDAAKEAWFKMVTSPTRFQSYRSVGGGGVGEADASYAPPPPEVDEGKAPSLGKQEKQNQDLADAKRRVMEQQKLFENMATGASRDETLEANPFLPKFRGERQVRSEEGGDEEEEGEEGGEGSSPLSEEGRVDLASRLEEAAALQEEKDAETRRVLEMQRQASEKARLEQQRRLAEEQRQRDEAFRRKESAKIAKQKEEEERKARAKEEKRKFDEERRRELQAAQDAYWQKKLAEETAYKAGTVTVEEKTAQKEQQTKFEEAEAKRLAKEAEKRKIRMHEVEIEDERELLHKAEKLKDESRRQAEAITDAAAKKVLEEQSNVRKAPPSPSPPRRVVRQKLPLKSPDTLQRGPVRQKVPSQDGGVTRKGPVRQALPVVDDNSDDSLQQSGQQGGRKAPPPAPSEDADSVKFSEDARKKASKWGINIDKLL